MSNLKQIFALQIKPVFLPVIHVESAELAIVNAEIAFDNGADGIFLIGHGMPYSDLNPIYENVRKNFPDQWIGLNYLDRGRESLDIIPASANALWADNSGIDDKDVSQSVIAFNLERRNGPWKGLYFGGTAFKHQSIVKDVSLAAKNAVPYVDVITTSGPKTGEPPSVSKIRSMRQASWCHPLAIASGMNPENVSEYMPYVDCFMVSTGISASFSQLDPTKTLAFARQLGK